MRCPQKDRAWQRHKGPYTYRAIADHEGRFEISGIRPDTYSVIARMNGFLGHARQDGVALAEGEERQTGVLTVTDAERGTRLWQIGDPDGTPQDFVRSVDSHEWCGWIRNYRRFFARDVHFVVGKSDPGRDWYYCQPSGWPIGYGRESIPTQWHIDFELPRVPARGVLLTIGIAATRGGELKIDCNQNALPERSIDESTTGLPPAWHRTGGRIMDSVPSGFRLKPPCSGRVTTESASGLALEKTVVRQSCTTLYGWRGPNSGRPITRRNRRQTAEVHPGHREPRFQTMFSCKRFAEFPAPLPSARPTDNGRRNQVPLVSRIHQESRRTEIRGSFAELPCPRVFAGIVAVFWTQI